MKYLPTVAVLLTAVLADTRYGRFWPEDMSTTPDDDSAGMTDNTEGNATRLNGNDDSEATMTTAETTFNEAQIQISDNKLGAEAKAEPETQSSSTTSTTVSTTTSTGSTPSLSSSTTTELSLSTPNAHRRTTYHLQASNHLTKNKGLNAYPVNKVQHAPIPSPQGSIPSAGSRTLSQPPVRNKTPLDLQTSLRSRINSQMASQSANDQNPISDRHVGQTLNSIVRPSSKKYFND